MESNPTHASNVLVVAGGDPWRGPPPRLDHPLGRVIAADSGVDLAIELGLPVSVVVGDMDSASAESLAAAVNNGARLERHPKDKDSTDLELALDLAASYGADEIVVLGGAGGRMSHFLGNAALLGSARYEAIAIRWRLPATEIHVVNPLRSVLISGAAGDLISLIPLAGPCRGITATALRWPLDNDDLTSATTRGISNEMVADQTELTVAHGTLLAVHERPSP